MSGYLFYGKKCNCLGCIYFVELGSMSSKIGSFATEAEINAQLKKYPNKEPFVALTDRCIAFPWGIPSELFDKDIHDKPRPDLMQLNEYVYRDTPLSENEMSRFEAELEKESIRWIEINGIEDHEWVEDEDDESSQSSTGAK